MVKRRLVSASNFFTRLSVGTYCYIISSALNIERTIPTDQANSSQIINRSITLNIIFTASKYPHLTRSSSIILTHLIHDFNHTTNPPSNNQHHVCQISYHCYLCQPCFRSTTITTTVPSLPCPQWHRFPRRSRDLRNILLYQHIYSLSNNPNR